MHILGTSIYKLNKKKQEEYLKKQKKANVGDYVEFGNYSQSANGDINPIEWLVLSKENNKILVISRYGLDCKRFDSDSNYWENSEIRQWANNYFYNKAFSENEKKYINSFDGDNNVFLFSKEEAEKYFANNEARKCKATEYAVVNSLSVYGSSGSCYWRLRSRNYSNHYYVYLVNEAGRVYCGGFFSFCGVQFNDAGFRPALWINL